MPREDIERVIGAPIEDDASAQIQSPGQLASHYAPRARLRLGAVRPEADEAFLAFGPSCPARDNALNLSPSSDPVEAAANLFAHLHALDHLCTDKKLAGIAAAPVPMTGLGEAINDRLMRAAAHTPRPQ